VLTSKRHLAPETLSWTKFHGSTKASIEDLVHFDIVITTYKIVSLQWKQAQRKEDYRSISGVSDSLFSVFWHRVVLDEGRN